MPEQRYGPDQLRRNASVVRAALSDVARGLSDSNSLREVRGNTRINPAIYINMVFATPEVDESTITRVIDQVSSMPTYRPRVFGVEDDSIVEFASEESRADYVRGVKDLMLSRKTNYLQDNKGLNRIQNLGFGATCVLDALMCAGVLPFENQDKVKEIVERGKRVGVHPTVVI